MSKRFQSCLFVCTGNTCRSPMAEYLFSGYCEHDFYVASAGIYASSGGQMSENSMNALLTKNQFSREELKKHRSQLLKQNLLKKFDMIVVMENFHKEFIHAMSPDSFDNIFLLTSFSKKNIKTISDPIAFSLDCYVKTMNQIEECLLGLKEFLER